MDERSPDPVERWPVGAGHDVLRHSRLDRNLAVTARGGDTPARYWTVEGLPAKSVAFGSDAPHLKNFMHKAICGPGSITVAHRDDECVRVADLATAVEQYIALYQAAAK